MVRSVVGWCARRADSRAADSAVKLSCEPINLALLDRVTGRFGCCWERQSGLLTPFLQTQLKGMSRAGAGSDAALEATLAHPHPAVGDPVSCPRVDPSVNTSISGFSSSFLAALRSLTPTLAVLMYSAVSSMRIPRAAAASAARAWRLDCCNRGRNRGLVGACPPRGDPF